MRKTITFEKPIRLDQNATKIIIESIGGEVEYRGNRTQFRPDIRGLEGYVDLEVPEAEEQVIIQAMESATVRKRVETVKLEPIEDTRE